MSYEVPEHEPKSVTAGDSIDWKRSLVNYSPATYTLKYAIRGPKVIDLTATAEGGAFRITVPAATSKEWPAGVYYWQAYVETGSEQRTVGRGEFEVLRNFRVLKDEKFDGRSKARISLEAIDAVLTKTATRQQAEYEIDGIRIQDKTTAELLTLRDHFKQLVDQERSQQDIENGRPGRKKILTRFVR